MPNIKRNTKCFLIRIKSENKVASAFGVSNCQSVFFLPKAILRQSLAWNHNELTFRSLRLIKNALSSFVFLKSKISFEVENLIFFLILSFFGLMKKNEFHALLR